MIDSKGLIGFHTQTVESRGLAISLHIGAQGLRFPPDPFPVRSRVKPDIRQITEDARSLTSDGNAQAYNEAAFTYFLDIERKRSERSNRPFMLLLADFGPWPGSDPRMEPSVAAGLLSGLSDCLRDTDFVGWYLHQQVAGAVLTERADTHDERSVRLLRDRVARAVSDRLPRGLASRLQVRVYHQMPTKGRES